MSTSSSGQVYGYDSANQRVFDGVNYTFWSPDGRRIFRYQLAPAFGPGGWSLGVIPQEMQIYFAGKLIGAADPVTLNAQVVFDAVATDRLGSVRARGSQTMRYFPYGQE